MDKERIIALDVGDRRIGVAVSDPLGWTAQPLETYTRVGYGPDMKHFKELSERYGTRQFLCGLPLNMDGTEGFQAEKVREYAAELEKAGFEVRFQDERLTTVEAEMALLEGNVSRSGRKQKVDMIAAAMILESYLEEQSSRKAEATADVPEEEPDTDSSDEDDSILEFEDEDGNPISLQMLFETDYKGTHYSIFKPVDREYWEDPPMIFEDSVDEDGEPCYLEVDDMDLIETLYSLYLSSTDE